MKRRMIIAMMTVLGAAAFATGLQESNGSGDGRRWNEATESVVMTGTLIEEDGHVLLETVDGVVSLSAPGFRRLDKELPLGSTITVTGSAMDATKDDCDCGAETHLFVEEALVNGEIVAIADAGRGRGDGRRNGEGDGRGNRRGGADGNGRGGRRGDARGNRGADADDRDGPGRGRWEDDEWRGRGNRRQTS